MASAWERALQRNDTSNAVVRARNAAVLRNRNALKPKPEPVGPVATAPLASMGSWERALATGSGGGSTGRAVRKAAKTSKKEPFDPLKYDWAAEGGGSRPSGVDVEALRASRLGSNDTTNLDLPLPEPEDDEDDDTDVPDYSSEGAALSAEVFGALAERRRVVDEQLQKAMEQEKFQSQRLKLAAETARTQVAREFRNLAEDLQMKLGGRGLATDPRFAGRGRRRLVMQESEQFGEISQTLADEIAALQEMVQTVSNARDREIAKIAQDEALARTNPSALLPASLQYSG